MDRTKIQVACYVVQTRVEAGGHGGQGWSRNAEVFPSVLSELVR
jgi:hypothetical protein